MPPFAVRSWTVDLDGPVHVTEHPGPGGHDTPPLVCVHGLGGSHANWHDLAPLLAQRHHVYALDLAGHGRTPRAGRSAALAANARLLDRFLAEVVGEPAVIVGNSMGASIAVLTAVASPEKVAGLVLIGLPMPRGLRERCDPALARQIALCAVPAIGARALGRRRRRLGPEGLIQATFEMTTADVSRVSPEMRRLAVSLVASRAAGPDSEAAFLEAARSLGLLLARASAYRAAVAAVTAPTLVLQGALDRLVPASGLLQLEALQPRWTLNLLQGVGHVPQIEIPEQTARVVLDWLGGQALRPRRAPAEPDRRIPLDPGQPRAAARGAPGTGGNRRFVRRRRLLRSR